MWHVIDYIQLKLKGYKAIGHVRYKNESMAPKEWKRSLWDKLKHNDLLSPININSEEHKKEFRVFIQGKVIIIAVNIFLFSFIYSFAKDSYTILKAKYNISRIEQIDFNSEIPKDLLVSYNWKKFKREEYLKSKNIPKYNEINKEINEIDRWIDYSKEKSKKDYFENNYDLIKSNLFSFGNNLLIIYMIFKYYWKRNKKRNAE
jgi:hypothetical protein